MSPPSRWRDVVVASLEPWDDVWRRNQYFADHLLRRNPDVRMLFLEPPIDVFPRVHLARRLPLPAAVAGHDRLWTFRPVKPLPRVLGPGADLAMRHQVRRAADQLGLRDPVLWLNDLQHVGLARATGWSTVYDITDDWLVESTVPERVRRRRRRLEATALATAREVVVCSPGLARSRGAVREVHLVPNGVDPELMTAPQPRPDDLPPAPAAVYVGTVHEERFDVELLDEVMTALPDLNVALVGPDARGSEARAVLSRQPRLHALGPRPHDRVAAYLQHADLVVVPHRVNDFTESLDPIKAYESLAVGVPTVATQVAGFRGLPAPVRAVPREDFAAAVADVLRDPPGRVRALPTEATWAARSREFERVLLGAGQRRIRVVYVNHVAIASGGEIALVRLLDAARDRVEAHVVLGEDGPLVDRLRAAGATVHVLPMRDDLREVRKDTVRPRGSVGARTVVDLAVYTWRLQRMVREIDPDLVHTNSLKAAMYGCLAGRLAGKRVVWHLRDRIDADYLPRPAVLLVRAWANLLPHAIIANSSSTLATLPTRLPSEVIHSSVLYDPLGGAPQRGLLDNGIYRVGIVGRLARWKGQHVFLEAFARAFPHGAERAVVVGSAMFGEEEYADGLRHQAERLGIADRVDFRGFRDDVWAELAQLDLLVHCSVTPEPFGQVVVEGMAAGVPVVAARAGGPVEIITTGVDGLLVSPGDVDGYATAMRRVRDDHDLGERLVRGAEATVQRFSPARSVEALLDVYAEVLRRQRGRGLR
ncbi:glycosyltransferase [Nocardioides litoris]|uniref:glycosyltransferase n=1 Tax=Nocardioides litoris TaxID=1926648 RepID=UPI00147754BF|nr:glycosyltransferase [Nocardioides litoris]